MERSYKRSTHMDSYLEYVQNLFDYTHTSTECTPPIDLDAFLPSEFNVGLLIGTSGSGKTKLLLSFLDKGYSFVTVEWDERSLIQQIHSDPEVAVTTLLAAGFSSIPQWFLPYSNLSEGQKFRAYL